MLWLASRNRAQRKPRHSSTVSIVPLRRGDTAPVIEVFDALGERSRLNRFHTGTPSLRPSMLRHLTDVRPGHHVALVARAGDRPVAVGRWVADPSDPAGTTAEIAIEVADDAQGRGVGKAMLAALARSADGAGIELFEALVHPGNAAVHAWARSLGVWPSTLGAELLRVPVSHLLDLSVIRRTA